MSTPHHDHPETPGGVDPADLDLYALHALPQDEADAVEESLVSAAREQRASMLAHIAATREVAAGLVADADLDVAPPPALRERVLEEVRAARAAAAASGGDDPGEAGAGAGVAAGAETDSEDGVGAVHDLGRERRRRRSTLTAVAAVAAAVVLVVGGALLGRLTDGAEHDLPTAAPPAETMPDSVSEMLSSPDLEMIRGQVDGAGSATVLASRSADMAVITMTDLPDPGQGRAYQLWLMGPDHDPIPAGTMESGQVGPSATAQLPGIGDSAQIGLTEEPAGGSPAPTGDVLLALELA